MLANYTCTPGLSSVYFSGTDWSLSLCHNYWRNRSCNNFFFSKNFNVSWPWKHRILCIVTFFYKFCLLKHKINCNDPNRLALYSQSSLDRRSDRANSQVLYTIVICITCNMATVAKHLLEVLGRNKNWGILHMKLSSISSWIKSQIFIVDRLIFNLLSSMLRSPHILDEIFNLWAQFRISSIFNQSLFVSKPFLQWWNI